MTDQELKSSIAEEIKTTGDVAPAGKYYCDKCGAEFEQTDASQALPNCPVEKIWTVWDDKKPVAR